MRRYSNRCSLLFSCLAISTALVIGLGSAHASAPPKMADQMANAGDPVVASPEIQKVLTRTESAGAKIMLLAQRDGLSFYRIVGSSHGECFGIGHGIADSATLGYMSCDGGFGWQREPVKDASSWTYIRASGIVRFASVQGFATNGVKQIVVYNGSGGIVATTFVSRNVYSIPETALSTTVATKVVALGANGAVLFQNVVPDAQALATG